MGQDPYPQPGVATGLAFGVANGERVQPSLSIIQTELALSYFNDITYHMEDTTLQSWHDQGVVLLNSSLSCDSFNPESEDHLWLPESHSYLWRLSLMENLFKWMSDELYNIVFVFMGRKAHYYNKLVDRERHTVLNTYHPVADFHSGQQLFVGSKIFNDINSNLEEYGKDTISW